MSTVSTGIPEDVEQVFVTAFAQRDLEAVVTGLVREAIARESLRQRRQAAHARILARRANSPIVTDAQIRQAREEGSA